MAELTTGRWGRAAAGADDLIRWAIVMAVTVLGAVILWDYGFLGYVIENDITFISQVILVCFVAASLYVLWHLVALSRELAAVERIGARLVEEPGAARGMAGPGLRGTRSEEWVADIIRARMGDGEAKPDALLAAAGSEVRHPVRLSVYMCDALYRLGMLGAVVGFIMMLASVADLASFDAESLRGALQEMTAGMAVSLLTTIVGLATGMILRVQANIIDSLSQRILRRMVRIATVLVPAAIAGADDHV